MPGSYAAGRTAAIVTGFGLGGFVDGIVAHQILGWHHMLSGWVTTGTEQGMRTNMIGDGIFHLVCLTVVVIGLFLVRRNGQVATDRQFVGALLAGWGLFNLLEGVVDHQILGVHHVRPGSNELLFDLGFLAIGAILLIAGLALSRPAPPRPTVAEAGSR